ncbi:MAG: polyphosphate kinase 1 [Candidatus Korobacteraceae bacterium]|jgi:polyphosphate kinase
MVRRSLDDSSLVLNREASWLAFNRRVLEEAENPRNPLLERVKFLAITARNLDEFFEIRVGGLIQRMEDGQTEPGPDGRTPQQEAQLVAQLTHEFMRDQYRCWNHELRPELGREGIRVVGMKELTPEQRSFVTDYCDRELDPLLTPVTVDPSHPFPRVINKALCQALLLRRRRRASTTYMGVVTVPRVLPRLIKLPRRNGSEDYIFLADLVASHTVDMYRGYEIISEAAFRVTRNSNLYLQEEESRNLLESVRTELHNRRKGDAVRLEIEADAKPEMIERLRGYFEMEDWQVYRTDGPVNLSRLFHIYDETPRPDLKFRPFVARDLQLNRKSQDIFEEIRHRDILLHHPYDSYNSVVGFIRAAAEDPNVLSIKQTLYRTSEDSPIVRALIDAAARKEVTVVVEVKARFDEASNIRWARSLEDAGVQVFHGLVGLKTHCKLAMMVRKDPDGEMRLYAHLGTGNYNSITATYYTDLSLFTAAPETTSAVHGIFNFLTAYAERPSYDPLLVAPINLAERTINLIAREADHARHGRPARIIAKMNSLLDRNIVRELYRASQAGARIDLIVRGICGLRPGVRGVSDHIKVRSIVGRFLEHSRIFCFANGGEDEVYLGSADWMPRNLYERVEVLFPIKDVMLKQRIRGEILEAYLADTMQARILQSDGSYVCADAVRSRVSKRVAQFNAQEFLIALSEGKVTLDSIPELPASRRRPVARPVRAK